MRTDAREMLSVGMFGAGSRLGERIEALLRRSCSYPPRVSVPVTIASTMALAGLMIAGALVPHWVAFAQERPTFEAASIKPADPDARRFGIGVRGHQFFASNASLKLMIGFAWEVQYFRILGGPKWISSDRFSIEATRGGAATGNDAEKLMLQSLLEDRFSLRVHRETRTGQIYELVLAKGGSRLKVSKGPDSDGRQGIFGRGAGEMVATNQPIAALAGILSQRLGQSVIDKTGLTDKYDFTLSFASEPTQSDIELFGPVPPGEAPPADSGLPSIFTAVQDQLGLRLQAASGPVEFLVVDQAEKPDAN